MYYHGKERINELIHERANARRERANARQTNWEAWTAYVPFDEWLRYAKGVDDWHSLKPYRRYDYYLEYQIECIRHGLEFQCPKMFGLYNTLMG